MTTTASLLVVAAVLVALVALLRARTAVRRLTNLSESYWELRYESGQLKARVTRLEIAAGLRDAEPTPESAQAAPASSFIPLSSLKK